MWKLGQRHISMMVLCAITIHIGWAVILAMDESALLSTSIHAIYRYIPYRFGVVAAMTTVAILAYIGITSENNKLAIALLLPQQILLMFSAGGAIEAMWLHQFADGTLRPMGIVAAGQFDSVAVAFWHTAAIFVHAIRLRQ